MKSYFNYSKLTKKPKEGHNVLVFISTHLLPPTNSELTIKIIIAAIAVYLAYKFLTNLNTSFSTTKVLTFIIYISAISALSDNTLFYFSTTFGLIIIRTILIILKELKKRKSLIRLTGGFLFYHNPTKIDIL